MLAIIGISYFPLGLFSIIGLFMILFPNATLMLRHYNVNMGGSIFDNYLEFSTLAKTLTRITGLVFIGLGIGIFMLLNGWLDSFIY